MALAANTQTNGKHTDIIPSSGSSSIGDSMGSLHAHCEHCIPYDPGVGSSGEEGGGNSRSWTTSSPSGPGCFVSYQTLGRVSAVEVTTTAVREWGPKISGSEHLFGEESKYPGIVTTAYGTGERESRESRENRIS